MVKNIWLNIIQFYINAGFTFYYKKIKAHYEAEIPLDKPVLFLSNHQNALLDPLLITVKSKRKNHFLTRASVFKNKYIASFLKSLQMLPVYRVRDSMSNITKNHVIFSKCASVLNQNKSIILFPEGSHSLDRTVRNLSKGFTRIISETQKKYPETKILIVPVGLNFQEPTKWADSVSIYFGKPIDTTLFFDKKGNLQIATLKEEVRNQIKDLTTHVNNSPREQYLEKIKKLNTLQVDYTNPKAVNNCILNGFTYTGITTKSPSFLFKTLSLLLKIIFWLPYGVWRLYVTPKIKEAEFIGTFRYAVILTLTPLFLIIESILISYFLSIKTGLLFFISVLVLSWITPKLR